MAEGTGEDAHRPDIVRARLITAINGTVTDPDDWRAPPLFKANLISEVQVFDTHAPHGGVDMGARQKAGRRLSAQSPMRIAF